MSGDLSPPPRLILVHKQATSARLRFLCLPHGVLAFDPLPAEAVLRKPGYSAQVEIHPTALLRAAEARLGQAPGSLEAAVDFHAWAEAPEGEIPVLLAAFTTIDPPFAAVEPLGGKFIAITDARSLPAIERELLRRVYEHVLG